MHEITDRIASLSPEKRELFLGRLAEEQRKTSLLSPAEGLVTGSVPLLPAQRRLFDALDMYHINYHHYNVAALLKAIEPLDADLVKEAVRYLLRHHDALRLRITKGESGWHQFIAEPDDIVPVNVIDLSSVNDEEQQAAIEDRATELQKSLSLADGPIIRVAIFNLGSQKPGRLLVIVHHQAIDAFALRVLLEDFLAAYQQLGQGKPIQLSPKTTSVKELAEHVMAYAQSPALRAEFDYWLNLPWSELASPPPDHPESLHSFPEAQTIKVTLSTEETLALIRFVPRSGGAQMRDILLAALAQVFARWTGSRTVQFVVLFNGRKLIFDDIDLTRTVGWLTIQPSILLQLPENLEPTELLPAVIAQLQQVPSEGMGFELLRDNCQDPDIQKAFDAFPGGHIVFNYLGQHLTSPQFPVAEESYGPLSPLPNLNIWKSDLQMIFAEIIDYQLSVQWDYSATLFERATIENKLQEFLQTLRSMIGRSQAEL